MMKEIEEVSYISVSCDTSNHGVTKLLPILIQYYDIHNIGITTRILEILTITDETSDTITDKILTELEKHSLSSKCVAFSGDNCNTNFGGRDRAGQSNVYAKLKGRLQKQIIGVGCPAHIINNTVHKGCDNFSIDIESIVMKIYNYFSVFTVRTEALKDFCQESDVEYSKLLYHSKTRWLSLYPAIERLLKLFKPLKNYFLSLENPPKVLKIFFENDFSEAFLFTIHSTMNIMHTNIETIERADNSIIEVRKILKEIIHNLKQRINQKFMPLKVKEILREIENIGKSTTEFIEEINNFYITMANYLESWIKPLEELDVFEWMDVSKINSAQWSDLEASLEFLRSRNIIVDEEKLFNEFLCFQKFVKDLPVDESTTNCNKLWCNFFKEYEADKNCQEMKKIAQFFFCLPAHNANVERVFSLITNQWTKERNKLQPQTISEIIKTIYNFKMTCEEFYQYLLKCDKKVLKDIGSSEKYTDKN
ncbi:hypothetical protein RF55_10387 [Lasius niger]|uniref:HAT C-terminal dimerisation domain-containing protein n=1 Tax=Lasius niger TaxID=67767 RepID=A0A0J7KI53_LASNI|nr:hypothetical protein RF55_10387 [Lasius niger]